MIFGDSMLKYIDAEKLSPNTQSENRCDPGSRIDSLIERLISARGEKENCKVTDVIIHSGTNNIPGISSGKLINKIGEALHVAQQTYTNAIIHFSPIIPKKDEANLKICDEINGTIEKLCGFKGNNYNFLHTRGLFVRSGKVNWDRLSRHDKLHLSRSGVVAMGKHIKYAIHRVEGSHPPPYSP